MKRIDCETKHDENALDLKEETKKGAVTAKRGKWKQTPGGLH